jgi:hypothetical protein
VRGDTGGDPATAASAVFQGPVKSLRRHATRLRLTGAQGPFPNTRAARLSFRTLTVGRGHQYAPKVRVVLTLMALLLGLVLVPLAEAAPPPGLSPRGRVLWNFEALLHDRFGERHVCTRNGSLNFVSGSCAPLAQWRPYFYVFTAARRSAFVTTSRRPAGSFGQGAGLVRISGRYIRCTAGTNARTFVIKYFAAASFTVDCLLPLP